MKKLGSIAVVAAAIFSICATATAQDENDSDLIGEELELTMTLLPAGADRPDVITKTIELPPAASSRGDEAGERGLETADEARENRQEGLDTAAEAREQGQEFSQEMAEQARENREDAGRGNAPETPPGPPEDLPVPPNPPQN
jgi:hypothetical protein